MEALARVSETTDSMRFPRARFEDSVLLPASCYNDEGFYRKEVDKVFMHSWQAVGRAAQLTKAGDFFTLTMFDEPVLVVRGRDDRIRAFSNVCVHRATRLATGSGNVPAFVCPYHAWTYNLDGTLRHARYMDKTPGFVKSECRLPEFRIEIWQGFIFINFDADAAPLGPQLKTLEKIIEPYDFTSRRTEVYKSADCKWNWKASLENFTESYHQFVIHPKSADPYWPCEKAIYEDTDGPYSVFWMPTHDGEPLESSLPMAPDLPKRYTTNNMVVNIYPNFHLFIDPTVILWLRFDIRGAQDHTMNWSLLVPPSIMEQPDAQEGLEEYKEILNGILAEDVHACEEVCAGQKSRFYSPGRLSWMEKSVYQMHSFLLEKLST